VKTVEQRSPTQYSPRRQSRWVLAETMVEKVSFEPGMKQRMCDGGWEWWTGGRWIRECDVISRVFCARLTEWNRKLIPEMRRCIAKWAIG